MFISSYNVITEAEKVASVSKIQYQQKIMEKESLKKMSEIEGKFYLLRMLVLHGVVSFYFAEKWTWLSGLVIQKKLTDVMLINFKKISILLWNSKICDIAFQFR